MSRPLLLERGTPPITGTRADTAVVALEPNPPGWLADWCQTSSRSLRTGPESGEEWPPFGAGHVLRAVAQLAGRTVWVARGGYHGRPRRVVAAIRDLPQDAEVLAEAASICAHVRATLVVAHAVPRSFAERSVGLDEAVDRGRLRLATAAGTAAGQLPPECCVVSRLVRARPHELVGEGLDADLLVIGGPRVDAADRVGLVLSSALHHAPCPVLLAPRIPPASIGVGIARV